MNIENIEWFFGFCFAGDKDKNFVYSHPKLKKLEEVVVEHFKSWNSKSCLVASRQDKVTERAKTLTLWGRWAFNYSG